MARTPGSIRPSDNRPSNQEETSDHRKDSSQCDGQDKGLFQSARPSKGILLNVSLIALTILLIAGFSEGLLHLLVPGSNVSVFEYTASTPRFKVMKPNIQGVVYGVPFETNNLGFRDQQPWGTDKDVDEFRILVLGDSYTVSAGVAYHSIYTQVLQQALQEKLPHRRVRVMNLGVAGYNPIQYLQVLREVGLALRPDYIIVGVFPSNDFDNTTYEENKAVAFGVQPPPKEEGISALYIYKAFGWRVENMARRLIGAVTANARERRPQFGPGSAGWEGGGWEHNASALLSVARVARESNIPLLLVLLPSTYSFEKQEGIHRIVRQFSIENRLECLDMLDELIKTGISPRRFRINLIDDHPNVEYNRIVGYRLGHYVTTRLGLPDNPEAKEAGVAP
jgi:lysophospholipase L1-like esterase